MHFVDKLTFYFVRFNVKLLLRKKTFFRLKLVKKFQQKFKTNFFFTKQVTGKSCEKVKVSTKYTFEL